MTEPTSTTPTKNSHEEEGEDAAVLCNNSTITPPELLPFVTVSDVVNRLNAGLQQQHQQQRIAAAAASSADSHSGSAGGAVRTAGNAGNAGNAGGGFELQTRLPDGSARPATAAERAAADCETRLQQAAAFAHDTLQTEGERLQWAERQRTATAHPLYQAGRYEQAIDAYLPCLTVAAAGTDGEHLVLFGKVMNNLALCALQCQWYRKTVQFCSMAFDHLDKQQQNNNNAVFDDLVVVDSGDDNTGITATTADARKQIAEQRAKLHFKRAKAYRLSGEYERAAADLEHATELLLMMCRLQQQQQQQSKTTVQTVGTLLDDDSNGNSGDPRKAVAAAAAVAAASESSDEQHSHRHNNRLAAQFAAVQKEEQLLQRAVVEAKRNKLQQQRAMQQLLGGGGDGAAAVSASIRSSSRSDGSRSIPAAAAAPLYGSVVGERAAHCRAYSSIRAATTPKATRTITTPGAMVRDGDEDDNDDDNDDAGDAPFQAYNSYFQMYLHRISVQAQRLLDWLDERDEQRQREMKCE